MPDQFWGLTFREFEIKHAAFARAEDRKRALVIELGLMGSSATGSERDTAERSVYALRRYPEKQWLKTL